MTDDTAYEQVLEDIRQHTRVLSDHDLRLAIESNEDTEHLNQLELDHARRKLYSTQRRLTILREEFGDRVRVTHSAI